jgi:hypothetical protein
MPDQISGLVAGRIQESYPVRQDLECPADASICLQHLYGKGEEIHVTNDAERLTGGQQEVQVGSGHPHETLSRTRAFRPPAKRANSQSGPPHLRIHELVRAMLRLIAVGELIFPARQVWSIRKSQQSERAIF